MATLNPCCAVILPTRRPLLMRWADELQVSLQGAWRLWNEASRRHAEQRTLEGLSDSTLRDIGLAERRHDHPTLRRVDWERGAW